MTAARRLGDAANQALKAAQAKNTETLFNEGGNIYKACAACHSKYATHLDGPPEAAKNSLGPCEASSRAAEKRSRTREEHRRAGEEVFAAAGPPDRFAASRCKLFGQLISRMSVVDAYPGSR